MRQLYVGYDICKGTEYTVFIRHICRVYTLCIRHICKLYALCIRHICKVYTVCIRHICKAYTVCIRHILDMQEQVYVYISVEIML